MFARVRNLQRILLLLVCACLGMSGTVYAAPSTTDLQREVDNAKSGEILRIPPGTYEGPLVITKPIQVVGEQVRIIPSATASADEPLVLVEANGATLRGLQLVGGQVGLLVRGDNNRILETVIQTSGTAVKLENSQRNVLKGLMITGRDQALAQRGNGIEIWNSADNRVEESTVSTVLDGVYLDNSERTVVRHNTVSNSRYAVHMMFSNQSEVIDNDLEHNVTGAMVMEDSGSRIAENRITKQAEHVQSQGILLYHVQGAQIVNNLVEGNRVGLYVDTAQGNRIANNQVLHNFLGMRMQGSAQNEILTNTWAGNVIQAQATDSPDNQVEGNYWDDHQGLDLNGDGHSDLAYRASPFFLSLTEAVPAYQLFFQTPGFAILENLFTSGTEKWLTDASPLLYLSVGNLSEESSSRGALGVGSALLLGAGILPFWQRMRKIRKGVSS